MPRRKTTEEFIQEAKKVHANRYDYTEVIYRNSQSKIDIICPDHGSFSQTPDAHKAGSGCPKCGKARRSKRASKTTDEFIREAEKVHASRYDYTEVIYQNSTTPVDIICADHGTFRQQPGTHLSGSGCPECGNLDSSSKRRKNETWFIEKAKEIHSDRYDYTKVIYKTTSENIEIICPEHGSFWQNPSNHIHKECGCPDCAEYGFNGSQPGILYYIQDTGTGYYKIGITNRTIKERFGGKFKKIKVIRSWSFEVGADALELEQFLHQELKEYQVINENFNCDGATEFFRVDVLNLATDISRRNKSVLEERLPAI